MSREWPLFVADMLDYCLRVLDYSDGLEYQAFAQGTRERDALLLNIILLGEAANPVPGTISLNGPVFPGVRWWPRAMPWCTVTSP